jgi:hypothetical protein
VTEGCAGQHDGGVVGQRWRMVVAGWRHRVRLGAAADQWAVAEGRSSARLSFELKSEVERTRGGVGRPFQKYKNVMIPLCITQ